MAGAPSRQPSPAPSMRLTGHSLRSCPVLSSLSRRSFSHCHWNQTMNLISVNINGLNDHTKQTALVDWLKCMKADVVCLQETHTPSHESARKWFTNSGYRVASSSFTSKSAGVAILVKDTWKISRIIKDKHGRFIQVFLDFRENSIKFCLFIRSEHELGAKSLLYITDRLN